MQVTTIYMISQLHCAIYHEYIVYKNILYISV